jgi:hypothetical protein
MTRTLLSGIAAATLLSLLASVPAAAGGPNWGCRTCPFSNGTQLTGLVTMDGVAAVPVSQRNSIDGWSNDESSDRPGKPTVIAQLKAKRSGQRSGSGWSCRTCGFSNGPRLTGQVTGQVAGLVTGLVSHLGGAAPSIAPAAGSVTLPSGEILVLR